MTAAAARDRLDLDLLRLGKTERQFIAVDLQLHGVAHRRELDERDLRAGDHAHVEKMLAQCADAAHAADDGTFAGGQFLQGHM